MGRRARSPVRGTFGSTKVGLQIFVMVAVIFILAPLVVLLRSTLLPEPTQAQSPGPAKLLPASPSAPTCLAGQGCDARSGDTTRAQLSASEANLVNLVNAQRGQARCPALRLDSRLMASARTHAADMAARGFASLINPDGHGPDVRAWKADYRGGVIEIIAAGLPTVDEVFGQWTDSSNPAAAAIKAKMTDCSRVSVGIAYRPDKVKPTYDTGIWVLDMGNA